MRWPDFFIAGAPKAGTSALHAALSGHPWLLLSRPKEPKFFLSDGRPPRRQHHRGPGDAHSRREWVWRESDYLRLWPDASEGLLLGESTPFYLFDLEAHVRIARMAPNAKIVVLLRDPVDRAYSNWMHLWSDGLEKIADFVDAVEAEEERSQAGWAPFWRYRGLGAYGTQLSHLYRYVDRERVLVLRYRSLVDEPAHTLRRVLSFLGVEPVAGLTIPHDNTRPFRPDTARTRLLAQAFRAGAGVGSYAPPQVWRVLSQPLLWELHRSGGVRPTLDESQRRQVLAPLLPDLDLLEEVTGSSFADWKEGSGRGAFGDRLREPAP